MMAFFQQHGIVVTNITGNSIDLVAEPRRWLEGCYQLAKPTRQRLVDANGQRQCHLEVRIVSQMSVLAKKVCLADRSYARLLDRALPNSVLEYHE